MDKNFALKYDKLEQEHWWFKARRHILKKTLDHFIHWPEVNHVVEIGTSSGNNLYHLYPDTISLYGVEPFEENLRIANKKGDIPVYKGTAEHLPEELQSHSFDLITLFDVLEHTSDDRLVLSNLHKWMSPSGHLVLTVPAYMWMWGTQDEVSHHYRRYTRNELAKKLAEAGFTVLYQSYFNTFLFPPIAAVRLAARLLPEQPHKSFGDFNVGPALFNNFLYHIFKLEKQAIPHLAFPFGVSIIFVAAKN